MHLSTDTNLSICNRYNSYSLLHILLFTVFGFLSLQSMHEQHDAPTSSNVRLHNVVRSGSNYSCSKLASELLKWSIYCMIEIGLREVIKLRQV